jgi:hypothetical protein
LFTTELVGAGLPVHVAATLLGHLNLDTTRGYTAVFPEQVIDAHRKMVEHRRSLRDSHEYRSVTPEEWADFEQHFQLRRVALGDCFRPYGTPCVHEHACTAARSYASTRPRHRAWTPSRPTQGTGSPRPADTSGSAKSPRSRRACDTSVRSARSYK